MTQEEKAKAYDEAINRMKHYVVDEYGCSRIKVADVFPELKESEDERIRKAIIATIHLYYGEPLEDEAKEMIAWLEKQGEQKSIDDLTQQEAMDIAVAKCFEQGEQKPAFETKTSEESLGIDSDTYNKIVDECIYGDDKSTWSEEEEKLVKNLISTLSNLYARNLIEKETKEKYTNLLKSIRPQNKYAYNPYKAVVESIAAMVEKYAPFDSNLQDFYDNVKVKCKDAKEYDSLYPQNTWKPSDEHYELEEFAKIVRGNLTGISKAVQKLFEAKYLQLTGNKMYGGFKD